VSKDQFRLVQTGLCSVLRISEVWWTVDRTAVTVLIGPNNLWSWLVKVWSGHGLFPVLWLDFQTLIAQQAIQKKMANAPEEEVLYIPSNFMEAECIKYNLVKLGEHEHHFLEGTAFDYIARVKTITKTFFASHANKRAQGYSQQTHTCSITVIKDIEECQTAAIVDYSVTRNAMISLRMSQHDPSFPPLSKEDTYRKPTHLKQAIGDSRWNDGALWSAGVTGGVSHIIGSSSATSRQSSSTFNPPVVTRAIRCKCKIFIYI